MNKQQIKKWSLLRHLNFKGYKRTASGNPLNMVKVMSPSQLTICGNAVQDGTPSPDAPVEVQLCGDRTGNLFDENKINKQNPTNQDIELNLDNNETYCLFSNINGGKGLIIIYAKTTGMDELKEIARNDTTQRFKNFVVDYTQYSGYILRWFAYSGENSINNIAIYKGSYTADTLPAYEPYGYKVSGRAEGLNLCKQTGNTYSTNGLNTVAEYQEYIINGTTETIFNLYLEKNINLNIAAGEPITLVTEILDGEIIYPENSAIYFTLFNSDNTAYIRDVRIRKPQKGLIRATGNLPSTNSGYNILIQCLGEKGIVFNNVRIRLTVLKGTYTAETLPPYEPYQTPQEFAVYLPEQIAKVGDVADTVVVDMEKQTAELRKNVGSVVVSAGLTLSVTGSKGDDIALFYKMFPGRFIANSETVSVMSDKLVGLSLSDYRNSSSKDMLSLAGNDTNASVFMKLSKTDIGGDTAESANTWIADNRITVYYVLAEPVTTDITSLQQWDAMLNIEGTVSITFDSTIPISNAEAEYYSKEYDAT